MYDPIGVFIIWNVEELDSFSTYTECSTQDHNYFIWFVVHSLLVSDMIFLMIYLIADLNRLHEAYKFPYKAFFC